MTQARSAAQMEEVGHIKFCWEWTKGAPSLVEEIIVTKQFIHPALFFLGFFSELRLPSHIADFC